MPPCTTKRRTTTNLKTKNNQNCQKIKLYGSLTTKELKKKHSFRPVGGMETGSQGGEDSARWQLVGQGVPHLCADNQKEQLGHETDGATQGSLMGK